MTDVERSNGIPLNDEITDQAVVTEQVESGLIATELTKKPKKSRADKNSSGKTRNMFDDFADLAKLLNIPLEEMRDEFYLFQIRKLMGKMGKVIARRNPTPKQLEKIFINSSLLGMGEMLVSPVYLDTCGEQVEKHGLENLPVYSLIDFPFGESSLKSKMAEIKASINSGVDGVTVVIPAILTTPDYVKDFKKQAKKIGKSFRDSAGIALNATDLTDEQLKIAIKMTERTKLSYITLLFGETALPELIERITFINTLKGNKKIKVLANVDSAEGIMQLFKLGVDTILTPFADGIGAELVKRFKIKGVNLR